MEIINFNALKEIIGNDKNDMASFYELFKEQTNLDITEFKKFITDKDYSEIAKSAHKLKSSYGSIGSQAAYEILANLDKSAKENAEFGKIESLFKDYLLIHGQICEEFEKFLK